MNKKLLKSIVCIAAGVGIATSIPFATTSCGSSSSEEKINPLPDTVYNIDANDVLKGFKEDIDLSEYDGICNAMQIPARVTSVDQEAFFKDELSTIPSFIKNLTFAESSNCSLINNEAFKYCSSLTSVNLLNCSNLTSINPCAFDSSSKLASVSFPSSLTEIDSFAFVGCSNINSIIWNAWKGLLQANNAFSSVCPGGTVKVTNPKDKYDSEALLTYLQEKCGLSNTWQVAKD